MIIENKATDLLGTMAADAAMKKVLGPDVVRPQQLARQTVNIVVQEFATLSQDTAGSKRLYDAAVKSDRASIVDRLADESSYTSALNTAQLQLKTILGDTAFNRLNWKLQNDSKITEPQAKNILAIASGAVVESLNSELASANGGAEGIAALFSETTTPGNPVASFNGNTAQEAGVAQTDTSSVMRFAPVLLLGALGLGTIKYCNDSAKNKIVAEERAELQQALGVAQQDAETSSNKIASLESEYNLAQSRIVTLQDNLGKTTAELEATIASLEAEQNVPNDVATLQKQLVSVMMERDEAVESGSSLNGQLKRTSLKYDNTTRKLEILRTKLNAVTTERDEAIESGSALHGELKKTSLRFDNSTRKLEILRTKLKAVTTERDETIESNSDLNGELKKTSLKFDNTTRKLEILRAKLNDITSERDEATESRSLLNGQLKKTSLQYDNTTRKLEILRTKLNDVAAERDEAIKSGSVLNGQLKRASLQFDNSTRRLEILKTELKSVTTERDEAIESASDLNRQLKKSSLKYDNSTRSLEIMRAELKAVKTELDEAIEYRSALNGELKKTSLKYDNSTRKLEVLRAEIGVVQDQLAAVTAERDQLRRVSIKYDNSTRKLEILRAKLQLSAADLDRERATVKASLLQQENEDIALAKSMSGLQEKIFSLQKSKADGDNAITALQQKIDSADATSNDTIVSLERELDAVRQLLLQEQQKYATLTATPDSATAGDQASQAAGNTEELPAETEITFTETKAPAKGPGSEAPELRDAIEQHITDAGLTGVSVESIENNQAVAITLSSGVLYGKADALLTREGSRTLNKIGSILEKNPEWLIDVGGHTDSGPIGAKVNKQPASNQELSSAWASSVVTFLSLTTDIKSETLSAKGYGETKPIADNSTAQGRDQNRRVEIILKR